MVGTKVPVDVSRVIGKEAAKECERSCADRLRGTVFGTDLPSEELLRVGIGSASRSFVIALKRYHRAGSQCLDLMLR
ncbi:MAG: hypothetical protein WCE97_08580 [Candidatus Cybelea sp.]